MRKILFILFCLAVSGRLCAAPPITPQDTEKRTFSGIPVRYRAGTLIRPGGIEALRELDRDLTRLFRAPGGMGACVIVVDRAHAPGIVTRYRGRIREILLAENFIDSCGDPRFRAELAAHILAARFGLPERFKPLPGWIELGLEGIRQNVRNSGPLVRNQQTYPVLRGLLGAGYMPDFRALMRLKNYGFTGSAYPAVCEFGRFLLETFARLSTLRHNALGDYTSGMLKGELAEEELYRTFLLPAITGGDRRQRRLTEQEFFRLAAEQAAFNARTPRPAADLARQLPDVLRFSVRDANGKPVTGDAADLPLLLKEKRPEAAAARQAVLDQLARYGRAFSPELLNATSELRKAVENMTGKDPESERAALAGTRGELEKRLAEWSRVEAYLEECEKKSVNPCILFRAELSTVSEPDEFLTGPGKNFFDEVERKYLEN